MTNAQIATLLNDTLVPNFLGEGSTIAEDLSNMIDLGTAIENATSAQLEDYTGAFVAGVLRTYFDERIFDKTVPGLFVDFTEWAGVIQRVKAGLSKVTDDVSQNLQNGVSYDPNVYVGFSPDNVIFTKDCSFELDWSVPNNMWRSAFKSEDELRKLISYIYNRAENTMNVQLYNTALATVRALIVSKAGDRIKLLTMYNTANGTNLSADEALEDATFLKWLAKTILLLKKAVTDVSTKYNDGSLETFTPAADVNVTMLSLVATALEVNMESGVFHKELVGIGTFDTVNFWQNSGTALIPSVGVAGDIVSDLDGDGTATHIENCIAVIHDKYSAFLTAFPEKVTSQYNGKGDFVNYFRRVKNMFAVSTNQNAIVLTLE